MKEIDVSKKKLPGCEPILMKYDKADHLIFSQDGNQRNLNPALWIFYIYDVFGRLVITGTCINPDFINCKNNVIQAKLGASENDYAGYILSNITLQKQALLSVNYYDNYAFIPLQTAIDRTKLNYTAYAGISTFNNAQGLKTGSRTYQLNDPAKYSVSVTYYDKHDRIIQTHTSNHLNGFDDEYFEYGFTNNPMIKEHKHSSNGQTKVQEYFMFSYDQVERLTGIEYIINDSWAYFEYAYDEVGRLKAKKVATETSTYNYNVRSWLTQIAGTKFNQTLTYNAAFNGVTPAKMLYNGNISAMKWKSGGESLERGYKFTYDGLSRLTKAEYGEGANIAPNNKYNEVVSYDK